MRCAASTTWPAARTWIPRVRGPRDGEDRAAFLQKWLGGGRGGGGDGPDAGLAAADLQVTETGQVATPLHARTIADLIADHAPPRPPLPTTPAEAEGQRERIQDA